MPGSLGQTRPNSRCFPSHDEWIDTTRRPVGMIVLRWVNPDTARFFGDRYAWVEFDADLVQVTLWRRVVSLALRPAQEGLAKG